MHVVLGAAGVPGGGGRGDGVPAEGERLGLRARRPPQAAVAGLLADADAVLLVGQVGVLKAAKKSVMQDVV